MLLLLVVWLKTPYLCSKKLSEEYTGYHDDMNRKVFERWFGNSLLLNLPTDRNVLVVIDDAKHHNRLLEKKPSMKMRKGDMLAFMAKHNISTFASPHKSS